MQVQPDWQEQLLVDVQTRVEIATRQDLRGGAAALFSVVGVHDDWFGCSAARPCQLHDSLCGDS